MNCPRAVATTPLLPHNTPMSQPPALPSVPRDMITSGDRLEALCDHLRAVRQCAFDTEFIGENSYQPVLCLVQVATRDRVELIDPFAFDDLQPLWDVLADPQIEKICHAGDQDLAIAFARGGKRPQNVIDTQIAAGMLALGYPVAYWRLVELYAGVTLDKAHTYSAWDRRPLSRDQFQYAIDDVLYLPMIWQEVSRRVSDKGHMPWLVDACNELCDKAGTLNDPRGVFMRLKGANTLNPMQLSVLRELAALREQLAYEHDLPPRQMIKDEALLDLANRMPRSESDLLAIRDLPREEVVSYGDQMLAAIERGRAVPPDQRPSLPGPIEDPLEVKRLAENLWAAAQVICLGQGVSPALVTSQAEMVQLARRVVDSRDLEKHILMTGWHRDCLGQPLLDLIAGNMQIDLNMQAAQLRAAFHA